MKDENKCTKNSERGITLIALVITIVVLLILAGVALATLTGDSGILNNAEKAKEQTKYANAKEQVEIAVQGALIEGLGILTTPNLKNELDKIFGSEGYKLTEKDDRWIIIVDGYKFEISKSGQIVYIGKEGDVEEGPTKNKYGFYYEQLYEGTKIENGVSSEIGYIFHSDGTAERFLKNQETTLGKLVCEAQETMVYEEMVEQGMVVSEDGLTITLPATDTIEQQVLTCELKEVHGLYFDYEYVYSQSMEQSIVQYKYVFHKDGTIELTVIMDDEIVGNQTANNITYIAHDYQIQEGGDTAGKVSPDGKYILINGNMIFTCVGQGLEQEKLTAISVEDMELRQGKEQKLKVTTTPSESAERLRYKSSDDNVATVDSNGIVTAVGIGETTITVTGSISTDIKDSCKVIVTSLETVPIGDYVIYNVTYTDVYTNYPFTETNGWRILDEGTANGDGTYSNVKLISTGIPAMLNYHANENAGNDNNGWWGTDEQVEKIYGGTYSTGYSDYSGRYAVTGLLENFESIPFFEMPSDSNEIGTVANANKGYFKKINLIDSSSESITGSIFKAAGALKVHNLTLEELNTARGLAKTKTTSTAITDGDTGLFYLKNLDSKDSGYGYAAEPRHAYWLALHGEPDTGYVRGVSNDGGITIYSKYSYYGVRPVVTLSSNIRKVSDVLWEIVQE